MMEQNTVTLESLKKIGFNETEARILTVLDASQFKTTVEIADELLYKQSQISRATTRLVDLGLVEFGEIKGSLGRPMKAYRLVPSSLWNYRHRLLSEARKAIEEIV